MDTLKQKLYALRSRTLRFFGLYAAGLWLALPDVVAALRENLPDLAAYLPADIYRWLSLAVIVGGIYYRVKTTAPVADYKDKGQ